MAVEHQGAARANTLPRADHVGAAVLHLLPGDGQSGLPKEIAQVLGDRVLGARGARDVHERARGLHEALLGDVGEEVARWAVDGHQRKWGSTFSPNSSI